MKLLIVEDDEIIQELYFELMTIWGYEYDIVPDGLKAIELVKKNKAQYNLCIMDVDMPNMSGLEATRVIRKIGAKFPILGSSSDDNNERWCYEAGMNDFVIKSLCIDRLFIKINKMMGCQN